MIVPGFTENWFDVPSCQALAGLVERVADVEGILLEVGAWEGRSTCAMAIAAHPRTIHTVDTWAGSPGEITEGLAAGRDVHARWQANVDYFTRGNVIGYRMGWRDYVPTIDTKIALAFIDAEHSYTEVRDNIEALVPLMASGGIMCGDDQHHPPVRAAVADVLGLGVTTSATLWIWRAP